MTKTLVEIWHSRNKPLLSERGLTLILRERGLSDAEIKQVLKEISFKDILNKAGSAAKKTAGAVKGAVGAVDAAAGKLTGKAFAMKATSRWKKYAAGAGLKWDAVDAEDFLEWLESTYQMPDFLIDKLKVGNDKLVDFVEKGGGGLTRDGIESLLNQIAKEEFKYHQSQGRYGRDSQSSKSDDTDEFKQAFLQTMQSFGVDDEVAVKLKKELLNNPDFLNRVLRGALSRSGT
jgi:hypothetical protein